MIDHYAILAKSHYSDGYYFVMGYQTLRTLRRHYKIMVGEMKNRKHDKLILVARNYGREIVKIYEKEE